MTDTRDGEVGARLLAKWISYDWDGLCKDGHKGFPQWAFNGIGALHYQGGKQGLRNLAKAITKAEVAALTRQLAEAQARIKELEHQLNCNNLLREPVLWQYELAHSIDNKGNYFNWQLHRSKEKPNVPEGSIKNLIPLYS